MQKGFEYVMVLVNVKCFEEFSHQYKRYCLLYSKPATRQQSAQTRTLCSKSYQIKQLVSKLWLKIACLLPLIMADHPIFTTHLPDSA